MPPDTSIASYNLRPKFKVFLKILMTLFYMATGINHFANPAIYLKIMPPYLPFGLILVYLSGFFEMALGLLLLIPRFTKLAAWGIIALLISVFPANIQMMLHPELTPGIPYLLLLARLPLQGLLMLWAYWFTSEPKAKGFCAKGEVL